MSQNIYLYLQLDYRVSIKYVEKKLARKMMQFGKNNGVNEICKSKIHKRLLIDTNSLLASSYSITLKIPIDLLIKKKMIITFFLCVSV
jgi:hypothetical protein